MGALNVQLLGLGLVGPGLESWAAAQPVLRGEAVYLRLPSIVPPPQRLPAAERRRAGASVRIAMAVADAACSDADADPQTLASVFTSSSGDGVNCHSLCETLANPSPVDRLVSPTRFTNSVHNAAAGYWHIAVGGRQASSSLCAYDASFSAGLIAALTQLHTQREPVLLVASDTPYPEPLQATRPLPDAMGVAMVLAPAGAGTSHSSKTCLAVELLPLEQIGPATQCRDAALEELRQRIPAARALPLLEAIACGEPRSVVLADQGALGLRITVTIGDGLHA